MVDLDTRGAIAKIKAALGRVVDSEDYAFMECTRAEEVYDNVYKALALLEKLQEKIAYIDSLPDSTIGKNAKNAAIAALVRDWMGDDG